MILNANEIKKLERLDSQPLQERMKATWDRDDIWRDRFHKSADRMYGIGANYYRRVVKANIGKDVKQVISQLKNNTNYKHKATFKKAVDNNIRYELTHRICADRIMYCDVYVDDQGIVRDPKDHPDYYVRPPIPTLPDIPERKKLLEIDGNYIMRENGIHYYVSQVIYMNALNVHKITWRWYTPEPVTLKDYVRHQLNKAQLKKHGLKNIWRK